MNKIFFHICAFEGNKFASLKLKEIDWGLFIPYITDAFKQVWYHILHKVWAQWRYENNLPHYKGPKMSKCAV